VAGYNEARYTWKTEQQTCSKERFKKALTVFQRNTLGQKAHTRQQTKTVLDNPAKRTERNNFYILAIGVLILNVNHTRGNFLTHSWISTSSEAHGGQRAEVPANNQLTTN
jgi:hypothetical protein